ncbi:MAG: DNA repair protein RecO C-terminal domain-containing protein [Spirochaetaceae bacterium]|jgi:DNA repair protein RecO (recombination protein O)|nr:DNA repair protein RecO C-terminal domain-containing protein [Spirochaetaceae bacterium]
MVRTCTYSALILRARSSGESNRDLWFLTAEEGILRATLFGGPKSRLRAYAAPFHQGTLWIYHDPVRDSRKVTDFDVTAWRPGIRERYERSAAASAVAETILTAHGGGGEWTRALDLAGRALDTLERADEGLCPEILIRFLWDWTDVLGCRPELIRCGSCACEAPADGVLWYVRREGILLCPACAGGGPETWEAGNRGGRSPRRDSGDYLPLGPGARRWLLSADTPDPSRPGGVPDAVSLAQAKALVTDILAGLFGRPLGTWDEL